jgi:fatty-acyl-CoA synthase
MEDFLAPRPANCPVLTPIDFLSRAADVFPDRLAVVNGSQTYTWTEYATRCRLLASALIGAGVKRGDVVAVLAPNSPAMLESHFGIPMAGGVINALNIRLDAAAISFILTHSEAKILLVDTEFGQLAKDAIALMKHSIKIVDISDPEAEGEQISAGEIDYEQFLSTGDANGALCGPQDEWETVSINYTSGTTGNPKGVLNSHRGMFLVSLSQAFHHHMVEAPVYLWTLPLFHVNGWAFAWGVAAAAGTHICLRRVDPVKIFNAIEENAVTHMCCAPTVLAFLGQEAAKNGQKLSHPVRVMTAGSAPPAAILEQAKRLGFDLLHVYGMTEMLGVASICEVQPEWAELDDTAFARIMARQGVRTVITPELEVIDRKTLVPVPRDGKTIGEVVYRGHAMKGYLKNKEATDEAFAGGWYHSGDLAVMHGDGYIELKDRLKDIIISGGENISSIEIEDVLYMHPAVFLAAVIAMPHDKWGETPCAFIQLKPGAEETSVEDILQHCRAGLAKFKVPKRVKFGPIETTATGKVQKFKLRELL